MPRPYRRQRLASLLVEFLSDLLRNEARDPRLGFVSITRIDVSSDLRYAAVRVSVMGDEEEQRETMAMLIHAAGWLRSECAARLPLRYAPALRFALDHSLAEGDRVLQLIREVAPPPAAAGDGEPAAEQPKRPE